LYFPPCSMDAEAIKQTGSADCPSNNIQICMEQSNVNVNGNVQNSTIDNNEFVDCMQSHGDPVPPVSKFPVSLPIIFGVSGFVIFIIIALLVFLVLKK